MINSVALEGFVSKQDPVFVENARGGYCAFKLFQPFFKKERKEGEQSGSLFNMVIWGERGREFANTVKKHDKVSIEGMLSTSFKEGRHYTNIAVYEFMLLSRKADDNPSSIPVQENEADAIIEM